MTTQQFLDMLRPHCLGWKESLHATYMMARDVIERKIEGDMVECGVYAGAECAVMARAIMDASVYNRKVHLFDSFEGIPAPGPEDHEFIEAEKPKGDVACPIEGVQNNMENWGIPPELLVYHPGWFEVTMPSLFDDGQSWLQRISLLRMDGDLYESTKTCMHYLYPRVSRGGWVIVDDYQLSGCRKAIHEVNVPAPMYFEKL